MARSLIVDGTNHLHVDWYGRRNYEDAMQSLIDRMLRFQEVLRPDRFVVCFDAQCTFRKELYPEYKAGRSVKDPALSRLLQNAPDELAMQGIDCITIDGFEADDLLATFAAIDSQRDDWQVILSSKDKDLRQCLAHGRVNQMINWKRSRDQFSFEWFTEANLLQRYKVTPAQWIDVQLLHGDPGDNVPGVDGIGEVTAIKLVTEHGVDTIASNPFVVRSPLIRERLRKFFAGVDHEITRKLVTLRRDVPLPAAWCQEAFA